MLPPPAGAAHPLLGVVVALVAIGTAQLIANRRGAAPGKFILHGDDVVQCRQSLDVGAGDFAAASLWRFCRSSHV